MFSRQVSQAILGSPCNLTILAAVINHRAKQVHRLAGLDAPNSLSDGSTMDTVSSWSAKGGLNERARVGIQPEGRAVQSWHQVLPRTLPEVIQYEHLYPEA